MKTRNPKMYRACGQHINASDDKCTDLARHAFLESDLKPQHTPTPCIELTPMPHIPTPWKWNHKKHRIETEQNAGGGVTVVVQELAVNYKDAAFLVRAVNSHEALLEAAKEVYKLAIGPANERSRGPLERLYQAIAKAEGV